MLQEIKKYILEGKTYQGLEIFELDGKEHFSLLKLIKAKGELNISESFFSDTFDELLPFIDKRAPLFVTFNTSKVLKKLVTVETEGSPELLVTSAFPNLEMHDFYYLVTEFKESAMVCISRREPVNQYLDRFEKHKIHPFSICLGLAGIESVSAFLEGYIAGSNFEADIRKGNLLGFKPLSKLYSKSVDLGGLHVQGQNLLAFSHILGHLNKKRTLSNLYEVNSNLESIFKNKKLFDFGTKAFLGFFLVILMGNFFVFSRYHGENQKLEASFFSNSNQERTLLDLKDRVELKEKRLKTLTHSKDSKVSFLFDELGKSIPKTVYLNHMQYQPLLVPLRGDKPIELKKKNIQISGVANDKNAFTVWYDNLELKKWVHRIEIIDYEYVSKSSVSFTLNLVFNEIE